MPEYAVEYRVQIQPIEIFWVLLVEPQQGAGLIIEVHAVCGQHAAPLVRYRGQGTERHIQKAKVEVQPAAHHSQHLATHPGLPLLVGLWPFGRKGLAGVEEFFFGQKIHLLGKDFLRPTSPSLLRNATSPSRRGLGTTQSSVSSPGAPLLGELSSGCETERLYREAVKSQSCNALF